jgi:hypothetical protein
MTLLQKTKEIVSNSIKSAIFIDEKALENYKRKSSIFIPEEQLSINLDNNFKKIGISLSVHKFKQADLINDNRLDYFFKRRDLVLLDWKLDGNDGEEYSLNLLSKVVKQKHIHFCSIYTSEANYDEIISNILTYFSGYNKAYYQNIIDSLDVYKEMDEALFEQISFDNHNVNATFFNSFRNVNAQLPNLIKQVAGLNDFGKALIQVKYAFSNFHKSEIVNPIPTHINRTNYSLNINNTIITIIPKTEDSASKILNKLYHQIYNSENCFTQLLGLDMQNSFSENSSFIDENLLNTKIDTLMFHRKQLKDKNLEIEFNNFIKSLLLKHSQQTLEESILKILEDDFLRSISKTRYNVNDEEIALLNTFYNGSYIKDKNKINFGDIFLKEGTNEYYMCITALCDCLYPENIKNNFFFVKGNPAINLSDAIKTGDDGFKSYINKTTCILWTTGDYVKPFQLHLSDTTIVNNTIKPLLISNANLSEITLKYVFSLKSSYVQRIANHTFAHPIRVGVDFVKK